MLKHVVQVSSSSADAAWLGREGAATFSCGFGDRHLDGRNEGP
jgi:hypothetical protein